jgi:cell division protein FtsN
MADPPSSARTRSRPDPGGSLKPYIAIVALLVVVGVVTFSFVERWLAEPTQEGREPDEPLAGGGRVVIGKTSQPGTMAGEPEPPTPEAPYKPQDFTFYKSLGNSAEPAPKLEPPRVPAASAPKPTERATTAPRKSYTVQIGSFQDRKSADRLAAKVRRYRYTVSVTRVVLPDSAVRYRVRIGSFTKREDALKLAETLKRVEKLQPFVAVVGPSSTS